MPTDVLRLAITIVVGIIAFIVVMLLGDYLGHKVGRKQLAAVAGLVALGIVIAFAIFAAVYLLAINK